MPLAKCRRCGGSGRYTDRNPTRNAYDWCAGCRGDGQVNVPEPNSFCNRCRGSGRYTDRNPTRDAFDWCAGCQGTGYAS